MKKSEFIFIMIILLIALLFGYGIGIKSVKPVETTKGVIIYDTSLLDSYIKLQSQFNQLQVEYDTFTNYLNGFERGYFIGYMRAKGIEVEE